MSTPPSVPPTIIPSRFEDYGAEDEADVELGLPGVVTMAEVSRALEGMAEFNDTEEDVNRDEAFKEAVDDKVSDEKDGRKLIGFCTTASPLSK